MHGDKTSSSMNSKQNNQKQNSKKDMQRSLSIFGYNLIFIVKSTLSVCTIIHAIEEEIPSHSPHGLN